MYNTIGWKSLTERITLKKQKKDKQINNKIRPQRRSQISKNRKEGKEVGQGKSMSAGLGGGTGPCSGHTGDSGAELKEPHVRMVGVKRCGKHLPPRILQGKLWFWNSQQGLGQHCPINLVPSLGPRYLCSFLNSCLCSRRSFQDTTYICSRSDGKPASMKMSWILGPM